MFVGILVLLLSVTLNLCPAASLPAKQVSSLVRNDVTAKVSCSADDEACHKSVDELSSNINQFFSSSVQVVRVSDSVQPSSILEMDFLPTVKKISFDIKRGLAALSEAIEHLLAQNLPKADAKSSIIPIVKLEHATESKMKEAIANSAHRRLLVVATDSDLRARAVVDIYSKKIQNSDVLAVQIDCKSPQAQRSICHLYALNADNHDLAVYLVNHDAKIKKKVFGKGEALDVVESMFEDVFTKNSGAVNAGKIVMYFAEWCGHCKRFKPHFKEAQEAAKTMYPDFGVVLNDCEGTEAERKACKDAEVRGFPTVKIYDQYDKLKEDYSGPRTKQGVLDAIKQHAEASKSSEMPITQLISPIQIIAAIKNSMTDFRAFLIAVPNHYSPQMRMDFIAEVKEAAKKSSAPINVMFVISGSNSVLDNYLGIQNIRNPMLVLISSNHLRTLVPKSNQDIFDCLKNPNQAKFKVSPRKAVPLFTDLNLDLSFYTDFKAIFETLEAKIKEIAPQAQLFELNGNIFTMVDTQNSLHLANFDGSNLEESLSLVRQFKSNIDAQTASKTVEANNAKADL